MPQGVGVRVPLPALQFTRLSEKYSAASGGMSKTHPLAANAAKGLTGQPLSPGLFVTYIKITIMSKVVRQDIDNLNAVLHITIEASDYSPKVEEELNKYRKKAQIKGFRAGKAPMSLIKKMYGRAFMADIINHQIQEELNKYITSEQLHILGQPLASDEQDDINFEAKEHQDFTFRFDLGLAPEFEVVGVEAERVFEQSAVQIEPERVQEEIDTILSQQHRMVEVHGDFQTGDLFSLHVLELDEQGNPLENGIDTTSSILFEDTTPGIQAAIATHGVGSAFTHSPLDFEKDRDEDFVRRYLLNLSADNTQPTPKEVQVTIEKVQRKGEVEMNQEFFDSVFGPDEVHDETEMRDRIKRVLESRYEAQTDALLFRKFQETLLELNPLSLPDAFLRRWILESNENATEAQIEAEYPLFAKNLQWTLIRNKLAAQFGISVSEAEIIEGFKDQVRGYFTGYDPAMLGDDFLQNMASRLMQDEKQVNKMYEDLLIDKLHVAIKGAVTIQRVPVSEAQLKEDLDKARASAAAAQTTLAGDEEE